MKKIAYYLPQYHQIEENDKWWGEGFTEWTNVQKAKPLFKGHYQPFRPLNDNYYCLNEKNTVIWQTSLADNYGLYGFAYYHYWFNGKLLLEKPAENLLKWKDINQKFFFFWANHSWIKNSNGKIEVLQKQEYGGVEDWKIHFEYFKTFFKDNRYIKIDNKPVIGLYAPKDIPDVNKMIEHWNMMAKENGFNGIYIIESVNTFNIQDINNDHINSDALVIRQPNASMHKYSRIYAHVRNHPKIQKIIRVFYPWKIDYKKIVNQIIKDSKSLTTKRKVFLGAFTGWDNTSRHGRKGWIAINSNPEIFGKQISELDKLGEKDDFMFINAWNEWAEGMFLEPEQRYGYKYLQKIRNDSNE